MRIGIDVSQLAYENTGVANYLGNLVKTLTAIDKKNDYVLFFSSFRRNFPFGLFDLQSSPNVVVKTFRFPPTLLDLLWNKLHVLPIESLIGQVDVFITSDWTEPPAKNAKKASIIYDLVVYKYPNETHEKIIKTQKKKLKWAKKESDVIFTISQSGKKDAQEVLGIEGSRIKVVYPGLTL